MHLFVVLCNFVLLYVFVVALCFFVLLYVFFVLLYVFFVLLYVFFVVVLCDVCFVTFPVLFVCICVPYYCHRVATQLQFNISYRIDNRRPYIKTVSKRCALRGTGAQRGIEKVVSPCPSSKGNLTQSTMLGIEVGNVMGSESSRVCSTGKEE
jgi:hypothetical protein